MYVAPKSVSARVVYTSSWASIPSTLKETEAPSLRPIQLRCMSFTDSGQSTLSRSASSLSAYSVIFSTHWRMFLRTTVVPHRSHFPSFTSSLAKPVLHASHQLIGVCDS